VNEYFVRISKKASKELANLRSKARIAVAKTIAALANNPHPQGSIKLSGSDLYRIRVRDFRIIYDVSDEIRIVDIIAIRRRNERIYSDV
jgi:mRNA interferase RelE/StbE